MASIFKRKTRHGKETRAYYIKYKDSDGNWKVVKGCPDKQTTKQIAATLESDALRQRVAGVVPFENGELRLGEFERFLRQKGNSPRYISETSAQISAIIESCKFKTLGDLRKRTSIDKVRKFTAGKSSRTANAYTTAIKNYCRWLLREGHIPDSGLLHLEKKKAAPTMQRRAASDDEIRRILAKAKIGLPVRGLTGTQRYWLYVVALATGFRAAELASLEGEDFHPTYVRLKGENAKNGKSVNQPLPEGLRLPKWKGKVWPGYWYTRAADMLRQDLGRVKYETKDGVLDFHALRATAITRWVKAGLPPEQVKILARHSTITLTMDVYTKLGIDYRPTVPPLKFA
jgi:integrase